MCDFKEDVLRIVPSNESSVIQKYLHDYVGLLQNRIDQYKNDLNTQVPTYPTTLLPLDIIDERLTDFVQLHHRDLLRAVNYQIGQLNTTVLIHRLSKQLQPFNLTAAQVPLFVLELI